MTHHQIAGPAREHPYEALKSSTGPAGFLRTTRLASRPCCPAGALSHVFLRAHRNTPIECLSSSSIPATRSRQGAVRESESPAAPCFSPSCPRISVSPCLLQAASCLLPAGLCALRFALCSLRSVSPCLPLSLSPCPLPPARCFWLYAPCALRPIDPSTN